MTPKIPRPVADMVHALRTHLLLLGRYAEAVQQGDGEYGGEVAGKLRLLAIEFRGNKALLPRLAALTGGMDALSYVADVPPGFFEDVQPGDVVTLQQWLAMEGVKVQTDHGPVSMTNADLIRSWAESYGAAHEDWSWSPAFHKAMANEMGLRINDLEPHTMKLLDMARTVHGHGMGTRYLATLSNDVISAAEQELRRRRVQP